VLAAGLDPVVAGAAVPHALPALMPNDPAAADRVPAGRESIGGGRLGR
jgi:hypothetical protein